LAPPLDILVRKTMDRMAVLARPTAEPSPVRQGAPVEEWARLAGCGCAPHHLLDPLAAMDLGDFEAALVGKLALQRLALRGRVEGWDGGYRPV
jgi:hypothetical protein